MGQMTNGSKEGIWSVDTKGRTIFANERMAEILGTTVQEMVGKSSFPYILRADVRLAQRLFNLKLEGNIDQFEFRLRRKDGKIVRAKVSPLPFKSDRTPEGGVIGTFSVLPD